MCQQDLKSCSSVQELSFVFAVSCAALFMEMFLIRWVSTEVRIFAYLQNSILVVCFLAMGVGFLGKGVLRGNKAPLLAFSALWAFLTFPPFKETFAQTSLFLTVFDGLQIWYPGALSSLGASAASFTLGLFLSFILMLLVWQVMLPFGVALNSAFGRTSRPLALYGANIMGSLAGVWAFALVGLASLPPVAWGSLALAILFLVRSQVFSGQAWRWWIIPIFVLGGSVALPLNDSILEIWSPYQKLSVKQHTSLPNSFEVNVNNIGYQFMFDLLPSTVAAHPEVFHNSVAAIGDHDLPYLVMPNPENVLIVGSGAGNDTAAALRWGARHVTSVDIDPAIIEIGKRFHPEHPYDQVDRVTVVNDDARAYFRSSKKKFDLIVFAFLDSHTVPAYSNIRLDHYVYTEESFRDAQRLLKKDGVMVLGFAVQENFIFMRIQQMLSSVFGSSPLAISARRTTYDTGAVSFVIGPPDRLQRFRTLLPDGVVSVMISSPTSNSPKSFAISTDDWPYLYLENPSIPSLFAFLFLLTLALYFWGGRSAHVQATFWRWHSDQWHFFFLGAAFLLLEVYFVNRSSLLCGTTWIVSAAVVSGVLFMAFVATLLRNYLHINRHVLFGVLVVTLLLVYKLDFSQLYTLSYVPRLLAVALISGAPVFFSSSIFAGSFDQTQDKNLALGINLLGAVAGGFLQVLSFVWGLRALTLVIIMLYAAAWIATSIRGAQLTKKATSPS